MSNRVSILAFAACLALLAGTAAPAQDQCFSRLKNLADMICGEITSTRGSSTSRELGAGVEAKVDSWLSQLVSLGGSLNAGTSKQEYENILREDLPQVLREGGECRMEAVKLFYNQACSTGSVPAPNTNTAATSGATFDRVAVMEGYPKVANVFSGPGVNYPITIRLSNPQLQFRTHFQQGAFWLVQMPRGRTGYMHVSRIRLLP